MQPCVIVEAYNRAYSSRTLQNKIAPQFRAASINRLVDNFYINRQMF